MRYVHTNIIARDWKRLSQFYIDVFGCKVVPPLRNQSGRWLEEGTGVKNAKLEGVHLLLPGHGKNGPTLEIYTYSNNLPGEDPVPNRIGLGHIAFEVENVDQVVATAINNGGKPFGNVVKNKIEGKGKITFTYMKDPEGNLIELQQWES